MEAKTFVFALEEENRIKKEKKYGEKLMICSTMLERKSVEIFIRLRNEHDEKAKRIVE